MVSFIRKSMKNLQELLEKNLCIWFKLGVNAVEEGFDLYKMKFRLGEASFIIRKWHTNDETLPKLIQECEANDNTRHRTNEIVKVMKRF